MRGLLLAWDAWFAKEGGFGWFFGVQWSAEEAIWRAFKAGYEAGAREKQAALDNVREQLRVVEQDHEWVRKKLAKYEPEKAAPAGPPARPFVLTGEEAMALSDLSERRWIGDTMALCLIAYGLAAHHPVDGYCITNAGRAALAAHRGRK